ncbi:MAG: hypothetical protein K0S29_36 [Gammaproteobacteria bacterium]|jgi:hypothetical protein|nr:hypothetical protein [Gammaproteobacteria bacterium]
MKNTKIWLVSGLSLVIAQAAHAIVILPPSSTAVTNCDVFQQANTSSPPAILNEKAQLQSQLCVLQNDAKSQQQSYQKLQQIISNTQSQIQAVQQKLAAAKNSPSSTFKWVSASAGNIPKHAFVAAENSGSKVYVCQANYTMNPEEIGAGNTYLYPGSLTANGCMITFGGKSFVENPYKILVSKEAGYWASQDQAGNAPSSSDISGYVASENKPIIGGFEPNQYIYVCRTNINNVYYIGKVVSGNCNVALQGKEASWPDYQVLLSTKPTGSNS